MVFNMCSGCSQPLEDREFSSLVSSVVFGALEQS